MFADAVAENFKEVHPAAHTNSREVDDQTVIAALGQEIFDEWRQKRARRALEPESANQTASPCRTIPRWGMSRRRTTPINTLIVHSPVLASVTNSRREVDDQTVVAILGQAVLDEWRQKCARWAMSSRRATPNNSLILHPPVLTS
jgi:hypothetical protein